MTNHSINRNPRRIEAKFRKPARGEVTSKVATPPEALDELTAELAAKGRALINIAVNLYDETGAHTLSPNVEWFVTRLELKPEMNQARLD
jgi:hypothetical protein